MFWVSQSFRGAYVSNRIQSTLRFDFPVQEMNFPARAVWLPLLRPAVNAPARERTEMHFPAQVVWFGCPLCVRP